MSTNLVFHNIPEDQGEKGYATSKFLRQVFTNKLKIGMVNMKYTELDKVDRFGRTKGGNQD